MTDNEKFEASIDLDDEYAHRFVVENFDDVLIRVTGTEYDGDGVDLELSQLAPSNDAVVEIIEHGEVHTRFIQRNQEPDHDDWTACEECGLPIDFTEVSEFYKTHNDERFFH